MGELVNLRLARKARARSEAERQAEQNRAKFGRSKAEKKAERAERDRTDKAHEAGRLEPQPAKRGD